MKHTAHNNRVFVSNILTVAIATCIFTQFANAHDVQMTEVAISFSADHKFTIDLYYDVYADLAQAKPGHLTSDDMAAIDKLSPALREAKLNEVRQLIWRRIKPKIDDQGVPYNIEFVAAPPRQVLKGALAAPMPYIARLTGDVPPNARKFTFWASKSFGEIALRIGHACGQEKFELIERGSSGKPFPLTSEPATSSASEAPSEQPGTWAIVRECLRLGIEHIIGLDDHFVPKGLDHILFVLGLFLFGNRWGPLLWQISAFTIAHTITLALSTYGIAHVSPRVVEPLIALSVAFIAIENIWFSRGTHRPNLFGLSIPLHRPFIVFCFGLLHGLGFAGALAEKGFPRNDLLPALLSFNVGVELGQLTVIAIAFLLVGWFRKKSWYRRVITIPVSAVIALVGIFWFFQRLFSA